MVVDVGSMSSRVFLSPVSHGACERGGCNCQQSIAVIINEAEPARAAMKRHDVSLLNVQRKPAADWTEYLNGKIPFQFSVQRTVGANATMD